MKRMPNQFYMFAMVLALYFWPWSFSLFDPNADQLLTAILLQQLFVISCNKIVRESWVIPIILIEALCMLFNVTLFLVPLPIGAIHGQIMNAAFILELLIITISMHGAAIGRANILQLSSRSVWNLCGSTLPRNYRVENRKC